MKKQLLSPELIEQQGFVWLAFPREGIAPLTLLEKQDKSLIKTIKDFLTNTGESTSLINADIFSCFPKQARGILPKIGKPKITSIFKGSYNTGQDLDANASLLMEDIVPFVKGASGSANINISSKIVYSFNNIKQISVESDFVLDEHINNTPHTSSVSYSAKLYDGKIYVITDVLQTTDFSIEDVSGSGSSGKLDVSSIMDYAKINGGISLKNEDNQRLSYSGKAPVTFALRASRIIYNNEENKFTLSNKKIEIVRNSNSLTFDYLKRGSNLLLMET